MKVTVFDRILALLACLLLLAFCVLMGGIALNVFSLQIVTTLLVQNWLVACAGALLLVLIVVRLFYAMLRSAPHEYLTISSQGGQVAIAVGTLKQIINAHVSQRVDIKACLPLIVKSREGIRLCLKVAFKPETILPQATTEIQTELSAFIGSTVGIVVEEVSVLVDNTAASTAVTR